MSAPPADPDRLPRHVLPHRYELELCPDLEAATFSGTVSIDLQVREETDWLVLHCVDLDITSARLCADGGEPAELTVTPEPEHEWIRLRAPRAVPVGTASLELAFDGVLGDQLVGFYRSSFRDGDTTRTLAVTQFESTHARRAFPCFDEPAFKARFGVSLVVQDGLTAVSNAAEVSRTGLGDGLVRITFADTMRMSSYLVAFVVGPLEVTEASPVQGRDRPIPLRVVHPPGKTELCAFALEVADAGLRFFEDYYDIAYPADKVDLVAVPDFAFGAMENLGCITFREVLLLVDPAEATPRELQRVADVINHELAHMWFGDLVTMSWWNGIWLNEAFATFMEVSASDAFRPEWQVWASFGLARAAAFDTDALLTTRPIEYPVRTAEDAEAMFDVLTYEKGCSVVRMLEQYLGPRVFRDGIRAYLRLNAYGNTETGDLWDALEQTSGEPVRRIMDAWIFRGGHPLVTVEAGPSGVSLSQRRALLRGGEDPQAAEARPVPMVVEILTDDAALGVQRVLLEEPTVLESGAAPARVQANVGGNGFYRTLLDDDLRLALAERGGSPLERFVLVDDTWFAVLAGLVDPSAARATLAVVAAREDDPSVWRRIAAACAELRRLSTGEDRTEVEAWVRGLATAAIPRFAPDADQGDGAGAGAEASDDAHFEVAGVLLGLAGVTGRDSEVSHRARELLDGEGLHPAISAAALEVVAATATPEEHARIERRWRDAATPQDEQRNLTALVATDDQALFDRALELAATEVRTQDAPFLLRRALVNLTLGPRAWEFVTDHWDDLLERFPASTHVRMLEGVRGFTDESVARSVEDFLAGHPLATGELQVAQHIERMWATVAAAQRLG